MRRQRLPKVTADQFIDLQSKSGDELVALRADLWASMNMHGASISKLRTEAEAIGSILRSRERPRFEVSDHAVVRWLEKFEGFDVSAIRAKIIERVSKAADKSPGIVVRAKGDAVAYEDAGVTFIVARDNCIVTCHEGDRP